MRNNEDIKNQQELLNASGPGANPTVDDSYFPDPKNAGGQPDIGSVLDNARKLLEQQSPAQQQERDSEGVPLNLHLAPDPNQHGGPDRANSKEPPFNDQSGHDPNPERWSEQQQVIDNDYHPHV